MFHIYYASFSNCSLVFLLSEMLGVLVRQTARACAFRPLQLTKAAPIAKSSLRFGSNSHPEQDPEFDDRWEQYFNKENIDEWELRMGLNNLIRYDCVPEPRICIAALRAARRLNDFATAVRIVEIIMYKAAYRERLYNYVIQEIKPELEELGVPLPAELGLVGNQGKIFGPGKS